MPKVTITKAGETLTGEVPDNTNLVVKAGIKQFPFPLLRYGCAIGSCAKCASRVVEGVEHLAQPNWKEERILGPERLAQGYRLICQLWLHHDVALVQDAEPIQPLRAAKT